MSNYITIETLPEQYKQKLTRFQQEKFVEAYNFARKYGNTDATATKMALGALKAIAKDGPTISSVHTDKPREDISVGFLQKADEKRYTLGIVYEPDVVDSQGDKMSADEIEKACWKFNKRLLGNPDGKLGIQHEDWNPNHGDIMESYIAPVDFKIGNQQVKKGTWLMGVIWNNENWNKIKNNEITGYSMGGKAKKKHAN